jgi:DNA polymerase-3 subunit gamma/tau
MMLYNKYRPTTFEDFLGNKLTKKSIQSLLDREEDRPHIFLLSGLKGSGKTTLARIIAGYLECNKPIELNFSDTRGIDSARELIERSAYMPTHGKTIVWIIDEVAQATRDAQNALLKLFEEPPAHVFFVLCTTDPQKLIATIKDRCYSYQLEPLSVEELYSLLKKVCDQQKKKISGELLTDIVGKAQGSARAALIMLDKIIDIDKPNLADIVEMIEDEEAELRKLCQALLKKESWKKISAIIKGLKQEPESIRYGVLGYMNAVLLNSGQAQAALIIECFKETFFYTGKTGLTYACYASTT